MKISVIIPVYNVAPYLHACLESVLGVQEDKLGIRDWKVEVICVDDGSTDGSAEVLDAYLPSATHYSLRVFHQENRGVSAAREAGLEASTGDWLMFVDGDDVIAPQCFAEIARHAGQADMIRFRLANFVGDEDFRKNEAVRPFPFAWVACAYHRSVIPKGGFKSYRCGEDNLFILECLQKARHVVDVDRVVYGYRRREASATSSPPTRDRFMDRAAYGVDWLTASLREGAANPECSPYRREIARARRRVARDVLGSLAIEVRLLTPQPWEEWYNTLERLLATKALPWDFAVLAWVVKTLRWKWLTRLIRK